MLDEREVRWVNTVRYLGVYLLSAKTFRCAIDSAKISYTDRSTLSLGKSAVRLLNTSCIVELLKTKCLPVLIYGLEVCSPTEVQIRSMDYAISSWCRKIFNVKSDENVRLCMDMLNCDDVDTMLMKRRQKFLDGYEHLDNLLCQITMSYSCN